MNAERRVTVPGDTRAKQGRAADPSASAWVAANAGSGKTFVLTQRVLRLLLAGASPESILCLTYTKAAAAEMRQRVSDRLAGWALMGETELASALFEVTGEAPDTRRMARARTLFAHALETPGGLKINTIHAFCEAVLQRFPLEAGVPVDFAVIEEEARAELVRQAREAVLAEGLKGHPEVGAAVGYLFTHLSDAQIETAIDQALMAGPKLNAILADPVGAKARLRGFLSVPAGESDAGLLAEAIARTRVPFEDYAAIFDLSEPKAEGRRFEDCLARIDVQAPTLDMLFGAYLIADGTARKSFLRKPIASQIPLIAANIEVEGARLAQLCERRKALAVAERTDALIDVLVGIATRYETHKRARSLLDFDDLVARTGKLFADGAYGPWVRYKLDAGIDHILVDESQDTNREQWLVIDALADDFFAGASAAQTTKTLFAVGDPKQSIYSFQGAEPALFAAAGTDYERRARAAQREWHDLVLSTSFRTLPGILSAVDKVAETVEIAEALLAQGDGVRHESARVDQGGMVELWPPVHEDKQELPQDAWPLEPPDALASAPRRLALRIASAIAHWVDTATPLGMRGRAVGYDDILILVQSRNQLFREIVRALREKQIPSPGADRLPVTDHIITKDLLGLADVLLNPEDDLLLAAILRSPLFDVTEDDLFEMAAKRGRDTLWAALAKSEMPAAAAAYRQLFALRSRLDLERPYEFFAHLLYGQGALKRFHARLGTEIDEVVAEFLELALANEQSEQPSLTGFIARMRASDVTIKRDLAEAASGVRVMTVHGAKGLEAPIVILADATATPPPVTDCMFFADHGGGPILVHAPNKDSHSATSRPMRTEVDQSQKAEYWRKLYVGMTRAEDALYVTGITSERNTGKGSWYEAIERALGDEAESLEIAPVGEVRRFPARPPSVPISDPKGPAMDRARVPLTLDPVPPPPVREMISPSRADGAFDPDTALATHAETVRDAEAARLKGIAIHALLQHLSIVPAALRQSVARAAAETLLPEHGELAAETATEALAIMADPELAPLFGATARAEVGFALDGARAGKAVRLTGRIDRLVVEKDRVLVVDYKSDAVPAGHAAEVPAAYCTQLGLYLKVAERLFPDHGVEAAILWTATRRLMRLDDAMLRTAVADYALA